MSIIISRFTSWYECFNRRTGKDQYTELDDSFKQGAEEKTVGNFQFVSIDLNSTSRH